MTQPSWPPKYDATYVPRDDDEHWDARLETMPPVQRDSVILERLRGQVRYAWEHSGFYREFWRDAPVDPATCATWMSLLNYAS